MKAKGVAAALWGFLLPLVGAPIDQSFDSRGVRIHYVEEGSGEPVILVHGFTSSVERQWMDTGVFSALAKRYRVIAFDNRGHGKSGKPHDPKQYGREMGQDAIRLMDFLGIQRAHLVGYSMGSAIAAQLLALHPERFTTLTVGGAPGRFAWTDEDARLAESEAAEYESGNLRALAARLWPTDAPPPTEEQLKQWSAEREAGQDFLALAAARRSGGDLAVSMEEFAKAKTPTLGIVGTADPYLKDFKALQSEMPQLKLVTIPDASHSSAPGRPEFIQALQSFLASHSATP